MISFKTLGDLNRLPKDHPAYPLVTHLAETCFHPLHCPDDEGWIVLIEEGDISRPLTELWDDWTLMDVPWEVIVHTGDYFQALFLANNEFGLIFLIPDAPWIPNTIRALIENQLDT